MAPVLLNMVGPTMNLRFWSGRVLMIFIATIYNGVAGDRQGPLVLMIHCSGVIAVSALTATAATSAVNSIPQSPMRTANDRELSVFGARSP